MANIISHLKKIIERVADLLLPKGKRVKFLEALGPDGLFENIPRADNYDFQTDKIKSIFNYRNALCRQAIWEIKFRANSKLIRDFSQLLYEFILEELTDLETFHNFKNIVLIPIPSSRARQREKGFNQCNLICQELIKIDRERKQNTFTLNENLLVKNIDTPHQTKVLNRKKRLENLKGSFSAVIPAKAGIHLSSSFIIIDDVITTGATINEAFRALKKAGAQRVIGFSLAH